jgi:hypothetical protein
MKTIDLSPHLNPARDGALLQAVRRADREGRKMFVYVGPPGTGCLPSDKYNTWFVRSEEEGIPESAQLFHLQFPAALEATI